MRNTFWKKRWGIFLPLALALVFASSGARAKALDAPVDAGTGGLPPTQADILCTYAIDPAERLHSALAEDGVVIVTAPATCEWTVDNLNDWVQIHFFTNGVGNGTVRYTVFANPDPVARSCVLTIGGQIFTIDQLPGPCGYSILPASALVGLNSATGIVTVFTVAGCSWFATATNDWIRFTSAPYGTGNGLVGYAVDPTYSPTDRTTVMTVAGQPFTLTQLGTPCRYTLSASSLVFGTGSVTGSVSVTTSNGCFWSVGNTNDWFILAGTNGTRTTNLSYRVAANPSSIGRTGVVTIAGQPIKLSQAGVPCTFVLAPTNRLHGSGSETGLVSVTSPLGCSWTALSTDSWISVLPSTSGLGAGSVSYQVGANAGPARTGFVSIAGARFAISQSAASPPVFTTLPASQSVAEGSTVT